MSGIEGVPVSACESIGVHGRRFDSYQIDPRYATHVVYEKPVAAALVAVAEAARYSIAEVAECSALHDALDALTAARGPHEAKGDG